MRVCAYLLWQEVHLNNGVGGSKVGLLEPSIVMILPFILQTSLGHLICDRAKGKSHSKLLINSCVTGIFVPGVGIGIPAAAVFLLLLFFINVLPISLLISGEIVERRAEVLYFFDTGVAVMRECGSIERERLGCDRDEKINSKLISDDDGNVEDVEMSIGDCSISTGILVVTGSMDLSGCPGGVVIFFTIFCDIFLIFFRCEGKYSLCNLLKK